MDKVKSGWRPGKDLNIKTNIREQVKLMVMICSYQCKSFYFLITVSALWTGTMKIFNNNFHFMMNWTTFFQYRFNRFHWIISSKFNLVYAVTGPPCSIFAYACNKQHIPGSDLIWMPISISCTISVSLRGSSGLDCSLYWRGFALLFLAWQRGARCGNGVGEAALGWCRSQSRGGPRSASSAAPECSSGCVSLEFVSLCTCVLCPVYLWVQCAAWDVSMAAASAEKGCSPGRLGAFTFIRSRGSLRKQLKRQHR